MKLYQVRKGQFVYYNNELHKVYGVKPMYKLSVHLIRLRDLTQHLTNAASVEKYRPKDRDSFIFNHKAYTLNENRKAEVGPIKEVCNNDASPYLYIDLNKIKPLSHVRGFCD